MTLLEAFSVSEGFPIEGSRSHRNNNPGDLIWGTEAKTFGATHGDPVFAVFPDAATGWKALQRWLSVPAKFDHTGKLVGGYCGATLEQAINRFAPPSDNNTAAYISGVCERTGLTPETKLTPDLLSL